MQKRGLIVLLCLLLVAGAASDRYNSKANHSNTQDSITVTAPFNPQYTSNQEPQSSVDMVAELCGISQFKKRYHTSGAGQKLR